MGHMNIRSLNLERDGGRMGEGWRGGGGWGREGRGDLQLEEWGKGGGGMRRAELRLGEVEEGGEEGREGGGAQ